MAGKTQSTTTRQGRNTAPRAFVCGWPITHSRSPLLHGYWLRHYCLAGTYEPVAVEPGKLKSLFERIRQGEFIGGNITLPHKEAALDLVDRVDDAAIRIGAINTVWMDEGRLHGTNTDWTGFLSNLDNEAPGWERKQPPLPARAIVIGAGGAARGILHALLDRGFSTIAIANRTVEKAMALANDFGGSTAGITAISLTDVTQAAESTNLLVNTSSMGMRGQPPLEPSVLDAIANLPGHAVVADIVYSPLETDLLATARHRGIFAVDGLGMLLHQAVPGFEKWFGFRPEVTRQLRNFIVSDLERGAH